MTKPALSENRIVLLIAAIQFANVLDFMMVMPMGPDFARALGIPVSELGMIAGSYTLSAAFAGLAGSFFLDRFGRKSALVPAMLGLAVATLAGGLSVGLWTLLATRLLAGVFGGPATSLSLSVVADVVPREHRARAMSTVIAASSMASIFGVPAGLELARWGGWRAPFFVIGALNVAITLYALTVLPPLRGHIADGARPHPFRGWGRFLRAEYLLALTAVGITMLAGFSVFPNMSAYMQLNLGFPREKLSWVYSLSGIAGLISMKLSGRVIDKKSAFQGTLGSTALYTVFMYLIFVRAWRIPVLLLMTIFGCVMSLQRVSVQTLTTQVPEPEERARYMSIQSAVQHLTSALGAMGASRIFLSTSNDGKLAGMDRLALFAIAITLGLPFAVRVVEKRVKLRLAT